MELERDRLYELDALVTTLSNDVTVCQTRESTATVALNSELYEQQPQRPFFCRRDLRTPHQVPNISKLEWWEVGISGWYVEGHWRGKRRGRVSCFREFLGEKYNFLKKIEVRIFWKKNFYLSNGWSHKLLFIFFESLWSSLDSECSPKNFWSVCFSWRYLLWLAYSYIPDLCHNRKKIDRNTYWICKIYKLFERSFQYRSNIQIGKDYGSYISAKNRPQTDNTIWSSPTLNFFWVVHHDIIEKLIIFYNLTIH